MKVKMLMEASFVIIRYLAKPNTQPLLSMAKQYLIISHVNMLPSVANSCIISCEILNCNVQKLTMNLNIHMYSTTHSTLLIPLILYAFVLARNLRMTFSYIFHMVIILILSHAFFINRCKLPYTF